MNLDNLFSMLPQQFIEELKNQRRDFLSLDVAKELDAAAFKLADKTKKAERLIVYLNIQLQHYLSKIESNGDLNFVPSAHFNEDHSKLRLCFNLSLDFSRLQYCLKLSGYKIDIEPSTNSIIMTTPASFYDVCKFVKQLQMEINKKGINTQLLTDLFPIAPGVEQTDSNKVPLKVKSSL